MSCWRFFLLFLGVCLCLQMSPVAHARNVKPGVVFYGPVDDKGFNASVLKGADRFALRANLETEVQSVSNDAEAEAIIRNMIGRGLDPIISPGYEARGIIALLAEEFPDTKFLIIDSVIDRPNVISIVFKEHEGSFLVGMLAAMKSKTGIIGFIGGMDIPIIHRFRCAYEQGARFVNPKIMVLSSMAGDTTAAWSSPSHGEQLAKEQIDQNADVIFAAAGQTGLGVLEACADNQVFSIGVDSNQNYLYPGSVLTSMIKKVDVALYKALMDLKEDRKRHNIYMAGLAEDGVDWTLDQHNEGLLTERMKIMLNAAREYIIKGKIPVLDYKSLGYCAKQEFQAADILPESVLAGKLNIHTGGKRRTVRSGIYITRIENPDMAHKTFAAQFLIWTVLPQSMDFDLKRDVKLVNTEVGAEEHEIRLLRDEVDEDGMRWILASYRAVLHADWDIRHYPFDTQLLEVLLEYAGPLPESVRFIPDTTESRVHTYLDLDGWRVTDFTLDEATETYHSTLGAPQGLSGANTKVERIVATVTIKRNGWPIFTSDMLGFMVANLLMAISLFIRKLSDNLNMTLGALFAAVGNKYVLDSMLPESPYITLTDIIQVLTFSAIGIITLLNTIAHLLDDNKKERSAKLVRLCTFIVFIVCFGGYTLYRVLEVAAI